MILGIEEKYRSILNDIEELYYEVDLAGNLTTSNDSMSKILGYSKDELIGMNNRQYMDEETSKKVYQMFNQVYQTGVPAKAFDWELIRKDGTRRTLETSISLMRDSEGRPKGFYGIGRDITDRKQAEEALRKSEEKYRTILHSIEDFYYEVDLAGNMTFFNDPLMKLSGYSEEELMGLNYRKYVSEETAKKVYETFNEVYRTGVPAKGFDWEVIRKDGTKRFVETSVSLMRDPTGQPVGFFGIGRDITERKQAEEQERKLRRAKDKVLNHLSHELRTPLAVIQGNIRILKRKVLAQPSPIVKEGVFEMVERNLTRISNIQRETNEIIRSYRESEVASSPETIVSKEPLTKETISLHPFTEQMLNKVKQNAAHRDLRIQLDGTNHLSLNMDARVLGDILMGLLRNSIENTPDGGLIRVVLEQKGQWIQLKVQDFGIGITKENQRHLFDGLFHMMDTELYSTKKSYDFMAGGKGLDLLKIKVYSKRFGFDISVGSQRCIHLPKERDLCPGKIAFCKYCKKPEDCLSAGGSTFYLSFSCPSDAAS